MNPPLPPRVRVAAYVVRYGARGPELLVFDHVGVPEAGTQVPAGGVERGEELSAAALREVREETGIEGARVVRALAIDHRPHPDTGAPRRTTYFLLHAPRGGPDHWDHHAAAENRLFRCRWQPLPLTAPLADHQDAWLAAAEPTWGAGVGAGRG
ncbi:NUDIX hydrolase [Streptomyces sp. P6-2-1]|uniref:NUDIX hydrolase n=1 Tax=unclassified Streptomyces TaxID=2593676 RepID=UPI003D3695D5